MEEKIIHIVQFIQEAEKLKSVLRTAWSAEGRQESTAEHSWRLALLAGLVSEEYPELDSSRVLMMCLIHDMGELYGGDISAALRPDPESKHKEEHEDVKKAFALLPEEQRDELLKLWEEYDGNLTAEAHLVKALDKAETIIQHNQGKNPAGFDYGFNLEYGAQYFTQDPLLETLRKKLDEETRCRQSEELIVQHSGDMV